MVDLARTAGAQQHNRRMMPPGWRQLCAGLAASIALGQAAVAAEGTGEQNNAGPAPRYAVEIIVFENLDQRRNTPEMPAPALPASTPPVTTPATAVDDEGRARIQFLLLDPHPQLPDFLPLAPDQYRLTAAWQRLETLDAYKPLLHAGWTQRAGSREQAAAAVLGLDAPTVAGLSGRIRLYKQRYLHLVVDLQLEAATLGPGQTSTVALPGTAATAARIYNSRRLRGDLVQYFDHPRFGVLASVRELQTEESPEEGGD